MDDIKNLIKDRRKYLGLSMKEVARKVGVSEGTISRWESGDIQNMRRDKIAALANALQISPSDIMGWDKETTIADEFPSQVSAITTQKVPLLGAIACGKPIEANEEFEVYVEVGAAVHCDFCVRAKGDSMINARIHDGDIVFIRQQSIVENGEIAAVVIDNEVTLKRFFLNKEESKLVLQAENPEYEPLVYVGEELDHVRVLGKAVAFQSDVK